MIGLLREWARGPQWLAGASRADWEPVLRRAQRAWNEIEVGSVSEGLRDSALVHLSESELVPASRDCVRVGLEFTPLEASGAGIRAAVHRAGLAGDWHRAWEASDDARVGELLGFPSCCVAFFEEHWKRGGHSDVVPFMRTVAGPWRANILLRWAGVRLVPHLPCSGDCEETLERAAGFDAVGRLIAADMEAINAVLGLPVDYSSLNGITTVETPLFRFMAGGIPGPVRRSRDGSIWHPGPSSCEDNGFASTAAMDASHAVVSEVVGETTSALDLGSGDGALLARVAGGRTGRWVGVEADEGRARRGHDRHFGRVELAVATIHDWLANVREQDRFDVVLVMPGRLLEMPAAEADAVRAALPRVARRITAYAYGDWLHRHGSLAELAQAAGLRCAGEVARGAGVEAAEVTV